MATQLNMTQGIMGLLSQQVGANPQAMTYDIASYPPLPVVGIDQVDIVVGAGGIKTTATSNANSPTITVALWSSLVSSGADDLLPNLPALSPNVGTCIGSWVCVGLVTVNANAPTGTSPNFVYTYQSITPGSFKAGSASPLLNALRWSMHFAAAPSSSTFNYQGTFSINGLARRFNL